MGSNISTSNETLIPVEDNLESSNHPNRFGEEKLTISDSWYQFERPLFSFEEGQIDKGFCIVKLWHIQSSNSSQIQVLEQNKERLGNSFENQGRMIFVVSGASVIQPNLMEAHYPDWLKLQLEKHGKYSPKEKIYQSGTTYINLKEENGTYYSGEEKDGKKHGYGAFLTENKFYEGNYVDGSPQGWGRLLTKDTLQTGFWNGEGIDIEMILITPNYLYQGECKQTKPHGKGYMENDKNKYRGDFHTGEKHGKGELYIKTDQSRYEGDFLNDLYHGEGTYYFPSGKIYTGMFQRGKFHGKGEMKWPEGKYYKGQFVNGKKQGFGEYIDEDKSVYKGQFQNDYKNGKGVFTLNGIILQGTWKDDVFQEE